MKILQVNCVYGTGSTGKIVKDIHNELMQNGIKSVVCYGRGPIVNELNVHKICGELYSKINNVWSRICGIKYGGLNYSTWKLERIILKEKPDVVHLHCINGYFVNIYKIISFLKKHKLKTVVSLHAEFMHTANCGHAFDCEKWKTGCGHCPVWKLETKSFWFDRTAKSWSLMKKAFDGFNQGLIVTSVSPWLMSRAKQSPILSDKYHTVVMNGLNTEIFHPYDDDNTRKSLGLDVSEKIVFHATPSFSDLTTDIKGGKYICELAKLMPSVKFVVAGPYKKISVPDNVILLGRVSDQTKLAQLYSMANVTILTSKRETFSMVCAESLSCGTPVSGFYAGGPESIALCEYSNWAEYGNVHDLKNATEHFLLNPVDSIVCSQKAAAMYSRSVMTTEYLNVYKQLISIK